MALLRARRSEWRQRYQLQHIGLYSFGEADGYVSTACNQATASSSDQADTGHIGLAS